MTAVKIAFWGTQTLSCKESKAPVLVLLLFNLK